MKAYRIAATTGQRTLMISQTRTRRLRRRPNRQDDLLDGGNDDLRLIYLDVVAGSVYDAVHAPIRFRGHFIKPQHALKPGSSQRHVCIGPEDPQYKPAVVAARDVTKERPGYWADLNSERMNEDYADVNQLARARRSYGDMPLIVLDAIPGGWHVRS